MKDCVWVWPKCADRRDDAVEREKGVVHGSREKVKTRRERRICGLRVGGGVL